MQSVQPFKQECISFHKIHPLQHENTASTYQEPSVKWLRFLSPLYMSSILFVWITSDELREGTKDVYICVCTAASLILKVFTCDESAKKMFFFTLKVWHFHSGIHFHLQPSTLTLPAHPLSLTLPSWYNFSACHYRFCISKSSIAIHSIVIHSAIYTHLALLS